MYSEVWVPLSMVGLYMSDIILIAVSVQYLIQALSPVGLQAGCLSQQH